MKNLVALLLISLLGAVKAHAVEYTELEVYGYQTNGLHELEIENATSASSDDQQGVQSRLLRSSFEFSYGLTDRWEMTAYLDYQRQPDTEFQYSGFRAHARTRLFEKGELPVDLGAYFEIELPRNTAKKDVAYEFKPIIEKDFSRWTISLNPQFELEHQLNEKDENATTKQWFVGYGLSTSLAYRYSEKFKPHLDLFQGFSDQDALLMPALDVVIIDHLKLTLGLGFGLNDRTEQRVANGRLEYELYF